jgi:hypothetical protein
MGFFANIVNNRTVVLTALAGGLIGSVGGVAMAGPHNAVIAGILGGMGGLAGGVYLGRYISSRNGASASATAQASAPGQGQAQAQGQGQEKNLGDSAMDALNSKTFQGITQIASTVSGAGPRPGNIPPPPGGGGRGPFT